ncbi:MAG: hypothetical protein ACK4L8_09330 [Nitrincola lacisaponensis]|uniref:hypothetical protein n=1 Tax=Nitrincola lacisaponensis TaxID=267850 RepID=UPI00391AE343
MKSRIQLLLLIMILGAPMPVAWAMLHWQVGIPEGHVARGELQHNLPPLSEWPLQEHPGGHWLLIWSAPAVCDVTCQAEADRWWRMHRAMGRQAARVERVRLSEQEQTLLPGETLALWQSVRLPGVEDYQVWLADPQGNIVTRYPAGVDLRAVHKDLEHLLKRNPES